MSDLRNDHVENENDYEIFWCLHCQRAIHDANVSPWGNFLCPFCGAGPLDLWEWEDIRDQVNKKYPGLWPDIPEDGKEYLAP
ncbi:MAG: hypothetical protein ABSF90_17840 [Syntrophobacteraceae bacterium]|jgi:hypothetical protein